MINCNKCYGQDLEELVWIDTVSGDITERMGEYHCLHCGCQVDIIVTGDEDPWITDIKPMIEDD